MAILGTTKQLTGVTSFPILVISTILVYCSILRVEEAPSKDEIAVVTLPCAQIFNWSASS